MSVITSFVTLLACLGNYNWLCDGVYVESGWACVWLTGDVGGVVTVNGVVSMTLCPCASQ